MSKPTTEEESKDKIANKVISPTRKYFVPGHGEVEAESLADLNKKLKKKDEAGDGNS